MTDENLWKCPKCGMTGEFIECTDFVLTKPDEEGFCKVIPTKIWCMRCVKEYKVNNKEVVEFT